MIEIKPYRTFGPLVLGSTSKEECVHLLGQPENMRRNREMVEELRYDDFFVRLDKGTGKVRECTLLPRANATIDDMPVTWDVAFLRRACERDKSPRQVHGFVVLRQLGIAITGIHDSDESQMAITMFSEGEFDDLLTESVPFDVSTL